MSIPLGTNESESPRPFLFILGGSIAMETLVSVERMILESIERDTPLFYPQYLWRGQEPAISPATRVQETLQLI